MLQTIPCNPNFCRSVDPRLEHQIGIMIMVGGKHIAVRTSDGLLMNLNSFGRFGGRRLRSQHHLPNRQLSRNRLVVLLQGLMPVLQTIPCNPMVCRSVDPRFNHVRSES